MTAQLAQRIQQAKQQGSSDEEILQSLESRLPNLGSRIQRARQQNISEKDILNSILNRFQTQQQQTDQDQKEESRQIAPGIPQSDEGEQPGILDFLKNAGQSSSANLINAVLKGGSQGLLNLARGFGTRQAFPEPKELEGEIDFESEEPLGPLVDPNQDQFQDVQQLIGQIPVERTEAVPGVPGLNFDVAGLAERGTRLGVGVLGDPTGLSRTAGGVKSLGRGALAGQAVEELGGGETAQAIGEVFGTAVPENFLKRRPKVIPKKNQELFVESARKAGLSEREIAPLVQSDSKVNNFMSSFSRKKGKVEESLKRSKEAITNSIKDLENDPKTLQAVSEDSFNTFVEDLRKIFKDIPSDARTPLIGDIADLSQSPRNLRSAMNFYRDINDQLSKGNDKVGRLKAPILSLFRRESPALAFDLELTNDLFAKFKDVSQKFKPGQVEKILSGSRPARFLWGVLSGNTAILAELAGETAGSRIAAQLTTNPRFKNLGLQFAKSINQNKFTQAQSILNKFSNEIRKDNPEAAKQLDLVEIDEIFKD